MLAEKSHQEPRQARQPPNTISTKCTMSLGSSLIATHLFKSHDRLEPLPSETYHPSTTSSVVKVSDPDATGKLGEPCFIISTYTSSTKCADKNLQLSTSSTTVWGLVQATASASVCVFKAAHLFPLQRASSAFWSESPFQPKR